MSYERNLNRIDVDVMVRLPRFEGNLGKAMRRLEGDDGQQWGGSVAFGPTEMRFDD